MLRFTPREQEAAPLPPHGEYSLFLTPDLNLALKDSAGVITTYAKVADVPGPQELPEEIIGRRVLSGLIDGALIGASNQFQDAAATLAALGFAYTSNANGTCIEIPVAAGQTLKIQTGNNYSGTDGFSANYDFPVPFDDYTKASIVATKQVIGPGAADGNAISAVAVSNSQFKIGNDDWAGPPLCGWIAIGI